MKKQESPGFSRGGASQYDPFITIHPTGSIVTVACAECERPVPLTRTNTGERVFHGDCYRRWSIAAKAREAALNKWREQVPAPETTSTPTNPNTHPRED